jgi:hypothetical protein
MNIKWLVMGILVSQLMVGCEKKIEEERPIQPTLQSRTQSSPYYQEAIREGRDTEVINELKKQLYSADEDDRDIAMGNLARTLDVRACKILIGFLLEQEKKMPTDGLEKCKDNPKRLNQIDQTYPVISSLLQWLSLMDLPEANQAVEEYLERFEKRYGTEKIGRELLRELKQSITHFTKEREMRLQHWGFHGMLE